MERADGGGGRMIKGRARVQTKKEENLEGGWVEEDGRFKLEGQSWWEGEAKGLEQVEDRREEN